MPKPLKGSSLLDDFLRDPFITQRIKIENFLLVRLGLRPCSQATLPFDLENGPELGAAIDERIYPLIDQLTNISDPRVKLKAIESIKVEMRKAFRETVESSPHYSAHMRWAEALGLRRLLFDVRPTVRELFLFREKEVERKLRGLMRERQKLRDAATRRRPQVQDRSHFAYPEEFNGDWLREMGELLGYPRCCVERYALEREKGISVEERSARQIVAKVGRLGALVYFVGYFFPCSPDCESALSKGRAIYRRLNETRPSLGEMYRKIVEENVERVRRQPEIAEAYREKAHRARETFMKKVPGR